MPGKNKIVTQRYYQDMYINQAFFDILIQSSNSKKLCRRVAQVCSRNIS